MLCETGSFSFKRVDSMAKISPLHFTQVVWHPRQSGMASINKYYQSWCQKDGGYLVFEDLIKNLRVMMVKL